MPRKLIKGLLPDSATLRRHPHLARFGARLHDPNLWHLNRRAISGAVAVGLFCALLPLPGQMLIAALLAFWWRVNLAASIALVWTTNPLTIPPVFYGTYLIGTWLLDVPSRDVSFLENSDLWSSVAAVWKPLLLGSLLTGVALAAAGFVAVRLLWRLHVVRRCRERASARLRSVRS